MERGFAWVSAYRQVHLPLPLRQTEASAGYDLAAVETTEIMPGQARLVPTGLKAYMPPQEFLLISLRSSLALKRGLMMANGVGIIDADYADNPENEGHIQLILYNTAQQPVRIERGERIAQGIFLRYQCIAGEDKPTASRRGGFGSTSQP